MSHFEFFMAFYSLLLGLGVAELLGGFANLLRDRVRPKLGLLTPTFGALLFIQIMSTFFDAFKKLQNVGLDFGGLALPTLIGILYFSAAVVAVPRSAADWPSLDEYFYRQRKWTIGAIIGAFAATLAIELPIVAAFVEHGDWPRLTFYLVANGLLLGALLVALLARPRLVVLGAMALNLLAMIYFYSPLSFSVFATRP